MNLGTDLSETKEVDQDGCANIRNISAWMETVHDISGKARRKLGRRNSKTETGKHLFLDLILEEDGVVVTAPFWVIQGPVDSW
jgi:hypothetical protein